MHNGSLEVASEEVVVGRQREVELERVEHELLALEDLLAGVGLVRDVDKVADLRGPDLLVLGANEHASDANLRRRGVKSGVGDGDIHR